MQTSLSYGASLNALTVPLLAPLPPSSTTLAQRLTAVQTLPMVLPPMVCHGIIPPATGKHLKTVTLGISGIPGSDLHHFRVDIVQQSYPSEDCINHCLYPLKQRRLLMYTQIASARERVNLLCLYASNDGGGSHAMLSAKKITRHKLILPIGWIVRFPSAVTSLSLP
ncbi:hypothetical protein SGGMMB4_03219 [Sodalis glossinidius str. 'morsitans']|uniref:Uncharacterized protein n=1 Tax=Sodalis glossinidius (strain morsitans) TaxID=343509 RepID=Q2NT24_SODGM|nr:hypothetical protein [Sodalis glossinidius]BAE74701.1 hypothetical protein SG1426 [Sodalis glossinidius str. 'morsitans']CRL45475.1 hypothetical protein SGGMMB4_03219 [Sodalis glossinidius str. 'morsitans']